MTAAAIVILALVTLQRLVELIIAHRHARALLARGAHEVGAGHYPLIVAVHAAWLLTLWLLAPGQPIIWPLIGLFVLEAARQGELGDSPRRLLSSLGPGFTAAFLALDPA